MRRRFLPRVTSGVSAPVLDETDVERRIKQTGIIIGAFFTTLGASLAYMWTHDGNIDLTIFNEGLSTFENSESLKGFIVSLFEFCKKYWHSFTFIAACCAVPVSIICMIVLICVIKLQTNEARKAQLEYNRTQIKTTNKKIKSRFNYHRNDQNCKRIFGVEKQSATNEN